MRSRLLFLLVAACLLAAPSYGWMVTIQTYHSVSGVDYAEVAGSVYVKLCAGTSCYQSMSEGNGVGWIGVPTPGWYWVYAWQSSGLWGSTTQPFPNQYYVYASNNQVMRISIFPRPLRPGLVSPCDYCGVGAGNFYLSWTNGLDAARIAPNWTVTYDLWDSSTPPGWPPGEEWLAVPDMPCNPDAAGHCRYWVGPLPYEPGTQYTWRIVAKINFGGGVIYDTTSYTFHLHQDP